MKRQNSIVVASTWFRSLFKEEEDDDNDGLNLMHGDLVPRSILLKFKIILW